MASSDKELEEQLKEAGDKLVNPPSSVDELLPLLDKVDGYLARVEQSPSDSMQSALAPSLNALITDQLFRHSDVDVNVAVASCISEITRITAPDAPYDDDQMKDVFQLIVSSFENLDDKTSRSYSKRTSILETVAKVRSCVVMLDLECDALIVEMFQKFLKSVREFHPENIVSSMETIMSLVLEESEDISLELLSPLLVSVKKGNKEVLPVARKLGEKVLESCAEKIKPYLVDALKSSKTSLDDYWDVVGSVCRDVSVDDIDVAAKNKVEISKPDRPLVAETAEVTPEVPDSAVSNGVADTGEAASLASSDILKGQELNETEHAKSVNADENVEGDVSAAEKESKPDHKAKKRGGKHAAKSESTPTIDEKEDVKLPDEKQHRKDALSSPGATRQSVSGDAAVASENKKKNDNQPLSPKAAKDESLTASPSVIAVKSLSKSVGRPKKKAGSVKELAQSTDDVLHRATEGTSDSKAKPTKRAGKKAADDESPTASPSVSGSLVDEGRSKKVARSKKKEGLVKELSQSTDDILQKETEGTSDSKAKPTKRAGKNTPVGTSSNDKSLKKTNKSKKEGGDASELDAKPLKRLSKVKDGSKSAEGALSKQSDQKSKRHGKAVSEKKLATSLMEDDDNENISSLKSAVKLAKDELPVEETPKTSSKRKRATDKALETEDTAYGEEVVGSRVRVWWPDDKEFYKGTIQSYDSEENKHMVSYDDGDVENLNLKNEKFEFIDGASDMEVEDEAAKPSSLDASEMPAKKKAKSDQSTKKEKMDISPKRGSGASTKSRTKLGGKSVGRKPKAIDDDSKTPKNTNDDSSAKTKKAATPLKSGLKTPGKSKTDDTTTPKATAKSKDDAASTGKSLKSKQETGKSAGKSSKFETPKTTSSNAKGKSLKSGVKPNANGTGKSKTGSAKVKDAEEGESSADSGEAQETKKEKSAATVSKEQGSEAKSGKKRPRTAA